MKKKMSKIGAAAGIMLFVVLAAVSAQKAPATASVPTPVAIQAPQDLKLDSKLMGREMPYRVIMPERSFDQPSFRYPVIYLLHGLTGHYDNWTDKTKLTSYALAHRVMIVMPEGGDGWYTDSVSNPNDKYESYIIKELIPEIDKKFRTVADRGHRAIAGLSMGGYGSLKFGLKYPELFSLVGSFSGALQAASFSEKNAGGIGKAIDAIYGPDGSETRTSNDIVKIAKELTPESAGKLPFIYLDCGTEDRLYQMNRDFASILIEKKVPHEFRELPGGHAWPYWDGQVQEFLRISDKFFASK